MNPEDELELETLRRDVEALGGDPNAVLVRAQAPGGAFRNVGTHAYEYKDPNAPGAAPGPQEGPMADELKHLGVVQPGPDGYDRVDGARLSLKNASATGELAREVEALRGEIAALGGNPDAVLERANRPAPRAPRQGRTAVADVDMGDVTVDAAIENDPSTLEGAARLNAETLRRDAEERKFYNDVSFPYQQYVDMGRAEPIQREEPSTPSRTPSRVYGQYRQQEELDFDQRQEDELRAMGHQGFGTTDAERQRNIRREIDMYNTGGPARYRPDPRMAGQLARELNIDPETGRTIGNVSEDEVRRALQRREELFL